MIRERRNAILDLMHTRIIHSPEALRELLARSGYEATPATIARDIKELGIVKAHLRDDDGKTFSKYVLPGDATRHRSQLHRVVADLVDAASDAENIVIVKTPPGSANMVAAEFDRADWPEVAGTLAGDDTIMMVCRTKADAMKALQRLKEMRAVKGRRA